MPTVFAAGIGAAATESAVAAGWFLAGSTGAAIFAAGVTIVASYAISRAIPDHVELQPGCRSELVTR